MAAAVTPASRIRASSDWSSTASGVVWPAASRASPIRYWIVPISPVRWPAPRRQRLDEERGGRLAVRAGDPDEGERARRMAVVGVGQPGQRLARGRHEHARGVAGAERIGALGDDERGAAAERVGR